MGGYIPSTSCEQEEMLRGLGVSSPLDLFADVPQNLLVKELNIPSGKSEIETHWAMERLAAKNRVFSTIFRGAGAYNHYIPAIVKSVTSREEFVTAYTPYQPEISQGILQSIYEYQTMICQLTGMDVSNASVYDVASAAAEAASMCRERKRDKVLISACVNPMVLETVKTYCWASGMKVEVVPEKDGVTDLAALDGMIGDETVACFYLQQPNFYGQIEAADTVADKLHEKKVKYIMGVNPIAAAMLKTPGECGADIAVGEGQPLGMPLGFGGPYLGFMAATKAMMRKLPGRIVGETEDLEGKRAFVLTLQAREQHIRREKASSNICSNQAHCALTASAYMATMGPAGMKEAARQCTSKAHYLAGELCKLKGFALKHAGPFFHEFVTTGPKEPKEIEKALAEKGILGGLPVEDGLLWCATEMNTKQQMDDLIQVLKEVCG